MSTVSLPKTFKNVAAKYKSVQIQTCSPANLVLLLLEGVIRFCGDAEAAIRAGDRARAGERTGRVHAILEELAAGLDMSDTTGLCENLMGVYGFCMRRVIEANLKQDADILPEVSKVIRPIRDAWAQLLGKP